MRAKTKKAHPNVHERKKKMRNKRYEEAIIELLPLQEQVNAEAIGEDWRAYSKQWAIGIVTKLAMVIESPAEEDIEVTREKVMELLHFALSFDLSGRDETEDEDIVSSILFPTDVATATVFTTQSFDNDCLAVAAALGGVLGVKGDVRLPITGKVLKLAATVGLDRVQVGSRYLGYLGSTSSFPKKRS